MFNDYATQSKTYPPGIPLHVIQRGNNRQIIFTCDEDIAAYANWLGNGASKFGVLVHAWVFMTNHVHLLLTPTKEHAVSNLMQYLGRQYVRKFNYNYGRSGTLFEDRFKSSLVQESVYLLSCLRYIELNPVRAGMVTDPGNYRWSSYPAHGHGIDINMWTPHPLYLKLAEDQKTRQTKYRTLIGESLGSDVINKIRHCTNKGLILGTENFKQQCQVLTGDQAS